MLKVTLSRAVTVILFLCLVPLSTCALVRQPNAVFLNFYEYFTVLTVNNETIVTANAGEYKGNVRLSNKQFAGFAENASSIVSSNIRLVSVQEAAFYGLKQLKYLDLSCNKLKTLHTLLFRQNPLLIFIDLHQNEIETIPRYQFLNLAHLNHIDISSNKIEYVHSKAFYNLPNLRKLDLSKNFLSTLSIDVFDRVPNLSHLNIDKNFWKCEQQFWNILNYYQDINLTVNTDCGTGHPVKLDHSEDNAEIVSNIEDANETWKEKFMRWLNIEDFSFKFRMPKGNQNFILIYMSYILMVVMIVVLLNMQVPVIVKTQFNCLVYMLQSICGWCKETESTSDESQYVDDDDEFGFCRNSENGRHSSTCRHSMAERASSANTAETTLSSATQQQNQCHHTEILTAGPSRNICIRDNGCNNENSTINDGVVLVVKYDCTEYV